MTALSGSGPAYFYFLVEAMTDAGILLGLPRQVAHDLIVQTAIGSAIMLRDSGEHPVKLREAVTSPAGTTISAIRELENHGVRAALLAALEAARDRARELAARTLDRQTPAGDTDMILDEARAVLADLRPRIDDFIAVRADLAELRADLAATGHSPLGALGRRQGTGGAALRRPGGASPRSGST